MAHYSTIIISDKPIKNYQQWSPVSQWDNVILIKVLSQYSLFCYTVLEMLLSLLRYTRLMCCPQPLRLSGWAHKSLSVATAGRWWWAAPGPQSLGWWTQPTSLGLRSAAGEEREWRNLQGPSASWAEVSLTHVSLASIGTLTLRKCERAGKCRLPDIQEGKWNWTLVSTSCGYHSF